MCLVRERAGDLEVLLARRSPSAVFVPGAYVFPGGAVDKEDDLAADELGVDAWILAAIRETYEEVGLLIGVDDPAGAGLERRDAEAFYAGLRRSRPRIDPDALVYVSTWVTPPGPPRRFDTRFYLAAAPPGHRAEVDQTELEESLWLSPRLAKAAAAAGDMMVITPTLAHLEYLEQFSSLVEAQDAAREGSHRHLVDQYLVEGYRSESRR